MKSTFALTSRRWYPWIFLALSMVASVLILRVAHPPKSIDVLIPTIAGLAGFVYFLYSQHLQQTKLFMELFKQFNERYDSLNDRLNCIAEKGSNILLLPAEKQCLYDYFNLCAEEYLYFKGGYIDLDVWRSWTRGMRHFADVITVKNLWDEELSSQSYYGFSLTLLFPSKK